jgi:hypothetical protein
LLLEPHQRRQVGELAVMEGGLGEPAIDTLLDALGWARSGASSGRLGRRLHAQLHRRRRLSREDHEDAPGHLAHERLGEVTEGRALGCHFGAARGGPHDDDIRAFGLMQDGRQDARRSHEQRDGALARVPTGEHHERPTCPGPEVGVKVDGYHV